MYVLPSPAPVPGFPAISVLIFPVAGGAAVAKVPTVTIVAPVRATFAEATACEFPLKTTSAVEPFIVVLSIFTLDKPDALIAVTPAVASVTTSPAWPIMETLEVTLVKTVAVPALVKVIGESVDVAIDKREFAAISKVAFVFDVFNIVTAAGNGMMAPPEASVAARTA